MLYPISEVRNLVSQLNHPEGLAVARDGSIYAGGETGEVYRISADGMKVQKFAATGGFCLGITLDRDENIYVCDIGRRSLLRVSQRGDVVVPARESQLQRLRLPRQSLLQRLGQMERGEWLGLPVAARLRSRNLFARSISLCKRPGAGCS